MEIPTPSARDDMVFHYTEPWILSFVRVEDRPGGRSLQGCGFLADDIRRYISDHFKGEEIPQLRLQLGVLAYLTKEVLRVQLQASPGVRMAAAGFSFQSMLPFSGEGRLCQGSMQTNFTSPGLDQIRV